MEQKQTRRLTYAAPPNDSVHLYTEEINDQRIQKFGFIPWTVTEVLRARGAGAWFAKSRHNFADRAAAKAAGVED